MKTGVGTKYTLYIRVTMTLDFRERGRMKRTLKNYALYGNRVHHLFFFFSSFEKQVNHLIILV